MKRVLMAAMAVAAGVAMAKTSTPAGWTDDLDAALATAKAEGKYVLVDFSGSDWCGWCKRLDREVFAKDEFMSVATNKYVLVMIDSPSDESLLSEQAKERNPKLCEKYRIHGFPTVLILDGDGTVVHKTGYAAGGPEKYLKALEDELKDAPDVAKYIKPIEDVLNEHDEAFNAEMRGIEKKVMEKYPDLPEDASDKEQKKLEKRRSRYGQQIMFGEIAAKYIPLYDAAFAKAKEMKVPSHMEARKLKLISEQERNYATLKSAKAAFETSEKMRAERKAAKKAQNKAAMDVENETKDAD